MIAIKVIEAEPAVAAEGEATRDATTDVGPRREEEAQAQLDEVDEGDDEDAANRPNGS